MFKNFAIFSIIFLVFAGAFGQSDSLNMHYVWGMPYAGHTMVMDGDTNIWFVMPFTDTLVKVDVSNPSAIDTDFFDVDSVGIQVVGIVDDTILIVIGNSIMAIDINDNSPSLLTDYYSEHFRCPDVGQQLYLRDSLLVSRDRAFPDSCLAFFNVSDPTNIDTFCTGIRGTSYSRFNETYFASKDSVLYLCYCVDYYFSGDPYDTPYPHIYVSVINIADYHNPEFVGTYSFNTCDAPYAGLPAPSVVADSFLYIAANFYDNYDAVVLNISNPLSPEYIGTLGEALMGEPPRRRSIAYQNGYIYVGPRIYNISSSPTGDSLVGYYFRCPEPDAQLLNGEYVYWSTGLGFFVLDFDEYSQVYEPNNRVPEYEPDFYLSPNPSLKYSNLSFPNPLNGTMDIYDIRGQKMEQIEIKPDKSTYTIDLSKYPMGLYLVSYNFARGKIVKKLVVLK